MKTFVPLHGTYMVFRIDPVAMVMQFDDPEVLAAAHRITTRKYVGYVHNVVDLPLPFRPWHQLDMLLVGRALGKWPDDDCMEPDMYTPIFPASGHPTREPLQTTPQFPFSDCNHYCLMDANIRVPTRTYDEAVAVMLPMDQMIKHERYINVDYRKYEELRAAKTIAAPVPTPETGDAMFPADDVDAPPNDDVAGMQGVSDADQVPPYPDTNSHISDPLLADDSSSFVFDIPPDDDGPISIIDTESEYSQRQSLNESVLAMGEAFMGEPNRDVDVVPLVKASFDLRDVEEGKIADPRGFDAERNAVVRLIQHARIAAMRKAHLDALRCDSSSDSFASEGGDTVEACELSATAHDHAEEGAPKAPSRASKLFRTPRVVKETISRVFKLLSRALRLRKRAD